MSQIYERQAESDPDAKKKQSVYYTPRRIADFMVKEVFAALEERGPVRPHEACVLDPAVGGGVFLVSAFQEIVAAWWRHHGRAPNTEEIRSILYRQLTGFDISEPALQLTALSLYLKSIEMDLDPHPPEKLKFRALRGAVLHSMRELGEEKSKVVLGSLGPRAGSAFRSRFDIVVGNPPWTPLEKGQGNLHRQMVETIRPTVAEKLGPEHAGSFSIPDLVPDLPFVWRSLEWAKPSGWIALALHGRLLFKTSYGGRQAREDLFRATEVTGILNGADLRKTLVWPKVTAPFCLLFARNQLPAEGHAFHFVSPYLEERLNRQGRIRIDAKAAQPVEVRRILARPNLLKTIFRGSALDEALLEKVDSAAWPTVEKYFRQSGLKTGQGYQVGTRERDVPEELQGKPELKAEWGGAVRIERQSLPRFHEKRLQWPRDPLIYRGPLALVRKSPPKGDRGRALCCFEDHLVYCESFYGYSAFGDPDAELLVRYLTLLIHSDFFLWYVLATSSEFGVERDAIHKIDVDGFPFRPLKDLPESLCREIEPLSESLFLNEPHLWQDLASWSARVYGLNRWDREVIRDTLSVSLPFPEAQSKAQRPPDRTEVEQFVNRLTREFRPLGLSVQRVSESPASAPWEVLALTTGEEIGRPGRVAIDELFRMADAEGASQILLVQPERGRLLLAIFREYRYWTPTRARLAALEILHENLGELLGVS
ncbi:MAG: N-6 DNA methylase [Acidobacteriota bacterium]